MICKICQENNLKSTVREHGTMSTLASYPSYYDEDGVYHHHDRNKQTTGYSCSNGHKWSVSRIGTCPNCDFGKDSETINYQ